MLLLVIFFFKQKTAYEMRISDWSSDVCSSDLGYTLHPSVPTDERWVRQERKAIARMSPARSGRRPFADGPLRIAARSLPWDSRPQGLGGKGASPPRRHLARQGRVGEIGSEEHTSELQSLMRPSDAVFCL